MRFTSFVLMVSFSGCVGAQVYACKDPVTGKTGYADAPCPSGSRSRLVVPPTTQEQALRDRALAAEASEKRYRLRMESQERDFAVRTLIIGQTITQTAPPPVPQQKQVSGFECRLATRELEMATSSGRDENERILKTNAAIMKTNQSCGTDTPLLKLPDVTNIQINNFQR